LAIFRAFQASKMGRPTPVRGSGIQTKNNPF
jgi:hypothetical protein